MTYQTNKQSIAIIGSGIAGLGLAYNLDSRFKITVYEKSDRLGGHIHSVTVDEKGNPFNIDIGFMVFNKITYPNFCSLIDDLKVETYPSSMSFSVNYRPLNLEWNGAGINKLFSQRKNILNLAYWNFLCELNKFNNNAKFVLNNENSEYKTIGQFIKYFNYSENFLNWYLIPIASAIWSINPRQVLEFPIKTLYQFFYNHGFLGLNTHFQWYTIKNSTNNYLQKLLDNISADFHTKIYIESIEIENKKVKVNFDNGESKYFDYCVVATHADTAINLLKNPSSLEKKILNSIAYEKNIVTVHKQSLVMPKLKNTWAAWNWRIDKVNNKNYYSTHYWVNKLQNIPSKDNYFVSLNASHLVKDTDKLYENTMSHPQYTVNSLQAQENIDSINKQSPDQKIFFTGSYFKYGFHEDAYTSGLNLSKNLNRVPSHV